MNPALLTPGAQYVYLTPMGREPLEYVAVHPEGNLPETWRFRAGRGSVYLPRRHVEEFVWPENEIPTRPVDEGERTTAGRAAFHAYHRMFGSHEGRGVRPPAWPDLSPTERASWVAAAMEGHQSFLTAKERIYHDATKPA